jgi:hypothetical protein
VATIAAWVGQHFVRRLIQYMGRASLIIFILAFTIFVSAVSLGMLTPTTLQNKIHKETNKKGRKENEKQKQKQRSFLLLVYYTIHLHSNRNLKIDDVSNEISL